MMYVAKRAMTYAGRRLKAGDLIGPSCKKSLINLGWAELTTVDSSIPTPSPCSTDTPVDIVGTSALPVQEIEQEIERSSVLDVNSEISSEYILQSEEVQETQETIDDDISEFTHSETPRVPKRRGRPRRK